MIKRRSAPPPTSPPTPSWRHAVIIGGGYGGLLAAKVLAGYFQRVTILERDVLAGNREHRSGVPQARHPHAVLARGAELLEQLFPGLRAELAAQGAPVVDFGAGNRLLFPAGWAYAYPTVISGLSLFTDTWHPLPLAEFVFIAAFITTPLVMAVRNATDQNREISMLRGSDLLPTPARHWIRLAAGIGIANLTLLLYMIGMIIASLLADPITAELPSYLSPTAIPNT